MQIDNSSVAKHCQRLYNRNVVLYTCTVADAYNSDSIFAQVVKCACIRPRLCTGRLKLGVVIPIETEKGRISEIGSLRLLNRRTDCKLDHANRAHESPCDCSPQSQQAGELEIVVNRANDL